MKNLIVNFSGVSYKIPSGEEILKNVTFGIEEHSSLTIIGHNGAGKSSLLKLIVADRFSSQGETFVFGHKLSSQMEKKEIQVLRSRIGFIHQGLHLVGRKNALENVLMGRLTHNHSMKTWMGIFNSEDYDKAYEAIKEVGMANKALVRADKLSGGERQKIAIARALAQSPRLLLADEPTAALDPRAAGNVAELLSELVSNKQLSLVTVVHSLELIEKLSERVVIMKQGHISFDGSRNDLSADAVAGFSNFQEIR